MKVIVIQGPNINMLGKREEHLYGSATMEDIHQNLTELGKQGEIDLEFFHTNYEGEIVDKIQESIGEYDGIILNAAAYSHTSIAIRDVILAAELPVVEVHITNIFAREDFRQKSMISAGCVGVISGFGPYSYHLALMSLDQIFKNMQAIKEVQEKQK